MRDADAPPSVDSGRVSPVVSGAWGRRSRFRYADSRDLVDLEKGEKEGEEDGAHDAACEARSEPIACLAAGSRLVVTSMPRGRRIRSAQAIQGVTDGWTESFSMIAP